MKKPKQFTAAGYAHWAPMIVNDDRENLSAQEQRDCEQWLAQHGIGADSNYMVDLAYSEVYFATPHGGNYLRGDCLDYTFIEIV